MENTPEGRKRCSRTVECTYKEACFELSRLEVERSDDRPVPTIGDAYRMWYVPWLDRRVSDGLAKDNTRNAYTISWKNVVGPEWDGTPVDNIKPAAVQKWLLTLSAGNANHAVVILRKVLDFAVQYELAETNKFRLPYEMPVRKASVRRTGIYDLAKAEAVLGKLHGSPVEAPYIIACFGSARTGESLGVRSSEVSLVESRGIKMAVVPLVRRMEKSGDTPMPDGDMKNPQSVRTGVIPEPYGTLLYDIAQQRIADSIEWMADRGDGLPFNTEAMKRLWEQAAGSDAIPFANLRNSWRTFAKYEWGIDEDTLEILMGHVIQTTTGRHYLRPTVEQLADAVAKAMVQSRAS
ncbi:hypothetical protein [Gordonibacter sp.]|uniref:hypothetical protein n=1 Tax=Gordonibacter sp. TaxID=1968902 RepID=UPI002FC5FB08